MKIVDDRTDEQKQTHRYFVVGTDSFMSGWGEASGGISYAAWACDCHSTATHVASWVRGRKEMKRVRVVFGPKWRPRGVGHAHVYVVSGGHPAMEAR